MCEVVYFFYLHPSVLIYLLPSPPTPWSVICCRGNELKFLARLKQFHVMVTHWLLLYATFLSYVYYIDWLFCCCHLLHCVCVTMTVNCLCGETCFVCAHCWRCLYSPFTRFLCKWDVFNKSNLCSKVAWSNIIFEISFPYWQVWVCLYSGMDAH